MAAWASSIDPRLVARLARRAVRPGVIHLGLAHRILAGVAAMADRLPLMQRFAGRRELAATTPIVHARWIAAAPPASAPAAGAVPSRVAAAPVIVRAASPSIERAREPVEPARGERAAPAELAIARGARPGPQTAAAQGIVAGDPRPTPGSPLEELAQPSGHRVGPPLRPQAPPAPWPDGAGRVEQEPAVRRSRVGAPLPARSPGAPRPSPAGPERTPIVAPSPAGAPAATDGARATTTLPAPAGTPAVDPLPTVAASQGSARGPDRPAPQRSEPQTPAPEPPESPRVTARVTPRAPATPAPARIDARAPAIPVVTPRPALQPPGTAPMIHAAPAVRVAPAVPAARHPLPVVQPVRSADSAAARVTPLPLAHDATPPAVAAVAARPVEPAPIPIASRRPSPPPAQAEPPAPPRIDLHRLAEQVHRILERQAAHARARQGLPR
jgi:hypothetical protein